VADGTLMIRVTRLQLLVRNESRKTPLFVLSCLGYIGGTLVRNGALEHYLGKFVVV
jgi:hypothetical protein